LSGSTDVTVTNKLVLTSGILTTGSNEVYVTASTGSSITGHQTLPGPAYLSSSYVNGNLRRNMLPGGSTGLYDFPVGSATNYELVELSMTNLTGVGNILGYFSTTNCGFEPNIQPLYVLGTLVNTRLNGGTWTLAPNAQPTSGTTYSITIRESGYSNPAADDSMYAVIKRDDCTDYWYDQGTHNDITQSTYSNAVVTAIRSNLNSFSDFAIGYGEFILPIQTH
jgi:hypothetical protein